MQDRLSNEDKLIALGMSLTYVCRMCFNSVENSIHLFLECPYVTILWNVIGDIFGMSVPRSVRSLVSMFEAWCSITCSSQIHPLWITGIVSVF